ncbi:hypothetical protein [Desulfonema magnum]|uniref:Uncharacterized protein n=1 Tax=Desulfonema magnum TaxID=45655 RepID=A0A975GNL0_9BACT|nr:hypothetical protein [Desulfonema magnum]QTA87884.1 Uncharacterized protein dnm_039240 [Desulfonema magnum]
MVVREQLYKIADELTPNASIEDVIEKLLLLYKIEKGLNQADDGKVIPHNEVEQRVEEW